MSSIEEKEEFTLSVFSENYTGMLSRVVSIFTRRHISVESLTASPSSIEGIYRIIIVVTISESMVKKLIGQFDKQIDVLKSFYYRSDEIVHQELALYKVPTDVFSNGDHVENMIRSYNARIVRIEPEYTVIEKVGYQEETEELLNELRKFGIYEFVRSGRVAVSKPMEQLNKYLQSVNGEMV